MLQPVFQELYPWLIWQLPCRIINIMKSSRLLFGDLKKLPGSQHDPVVWLQQAVANQVSLPKLFIACGKQDKLFPLNIYFNAACQKAQVDVEYRESDGDHNWTYWNEQIQWFLSRVLEPVSG